jgi:membrane protein implicated in regulation of membrane protease activity
VFLIVAIVLLVVLPSPWRFVAFGLSFTLFLGELAFWNRTVRGRRAQVGTVTLLGQTATVVTSCRPDGQVRLGGEIWRARCAQGADPGDSVVVAAQEELTLVVKRAATT